MLTIPKWAQKLAFRLRQSPLVEVKKNRSILQYEPVFFDSTKGAFTRPKCQFMSPLRYRFLDPKNDVAFRKIFGTEKNKDILIHFLNDVVKFGKGAEIKDVTFLKTIQDPEIKEKKTSIVDILC